MVYPKGRVTVPGESGAVAETKMLIDRLSADGLRNSDGTNIPRELEETDCILYGTYFISRGGSANELAGSDRRFLQEILLMSKRHTAEGHQLEIYLLEGYYEEQLQVDFDHDPKKWWEVIDRTKGESVPSAYWDYDTERGVVVLRHAEPYHEYTVSFFAYAVWDPTQMYNHITNSWGDVPHDVPIDIRDEDAFAFAKEELRRWLRENPKIGVVRFTTFFYHFTLVYNSYAKEKYVDWFGYGTSVSPETLEAFEAEYGYSLRIEDLVDEGYYNSTFRIPTKRYLDYMDFMGKFVCRRAKEFVHIVHEAGRQAMMFLGDNWIGAEPYGKYFSEIGLDAVVGSVGDGTTLRMISDIPSVKYTEGRFLPYFFPDVFREGGNPTNEAREVWLKARRALMRSPIDRIGYGGYPSLAAKFPRFVDYISNVANEFRRIMEKTEKTKPYCAIKVAVIDCWGHIRSWQEHTVAHSIWYRETYSYSGVLEALSGLPAEVSFISFEDIAEGGIPEGIDVIINVGARDTAFSGGEWWRNSAVSEKIRSFVHGGGGFIGVGEPSATHFGGKFFQTSDIIGVEREMSFSLSERKYPPDKTWHHFILCDVGENVFFGEPVNNIYPVGDRVQVLSYDEKGSVQLAVNEAGGGRGVYISGLPYSSANSRLLWRAMLWSSHKEEEARRLYTDNIYVEVHHYPEVELTAIVNNSDMIRQTVYYGKNGEKKLLELNAEECRFITEK